jgi:hypothetical protein
MGKRRASTASKLGVATGTVPKLKVSVGSAQLVFLFGPLTEWNGPRRTILDLLLNSEDTVPVGPRLDDGLRLNQFGDDFRTLRFRTATISPGPLRR